MSVSVASGNKRGETCWVGGRQSEVVDVSRGEGQRGQRESEAAGGGEGTGRGCGWEGLVRENLFTVSRQTCK